jgi:hypothetical protein
MKVLAYPQDRSNRDIARRLRVHRAGTRYLGIRVESDNG